MLRCRGTACRSCRTASPGQELRGHPGRLAFRGACVEVRGRQAKSQGSADRWLPRRTRRAVERIPVRAGDGRVAVATQTRVGIESFRHRPLAVFHPWRCRPRTATQRATKTSRPAALTRRRPESSDPFKAERSADSPAEGLTRHAPTAIAAQIFPSNTFCTISVIFSGLIGALYDRPLM